MTLFIQKIHKGYTFLVFLKSRQRNFFKNSIIYKKFFKKCSYSCKVSYPCSTQLLKL